MTSLNYSQNKLELVSHLKQFGMDISGLNWNNKMLVIHTMHNALEITKKSPNDIRHILMMTLAFCYEDRGFLHESTYWFTKCLDENQCNNYPLYRLHAQGNLIINFINLKSMPDAQLLLCGIPCNAPDNADASAYLEQRKALELYYEIKKRSLEQNPAYDQIEALAGNLLAITERYHAYFLTQKLALDVLETQARLSLGRVDYESSIHLFKHAAAAAFRFGNKQKAADCRKAISGIFEGMGNFEQAWRQYKKYYKLSAELNRKRSEEFSDYLFAINNLRETEQELSNLREMKEYLSLRRNTDALTGVYNRRYWEEALDQKAAAATVEALFSIFMLDIDSFKQYNDTFGHVEGDRALKTIGTMLKGCIRTGTDVIARFGGDEFVLLVDGIDEEGSKHLAERIIGSIRDYKFNGNNLALTLSIGISTGGIGRERNFSGLMEEADAALYFSKFSGKNKYTHMLDLKRDGYK